jgi:hypothetical protein
MPQLLLNNCGCVLLEKVQQSKYLQRETVDLVVAPMKIQMTLKLIRSWTRRTGKTMMQRKGHDNVPISNI